MRYLITGGTGTIGQALTGRLLENPSVEEIRIFSRGELLQYDMEQKFQSDKLTFIIGDVRDKKRLTQSMEGVDTVIHTAALKQILKGEENPTEVIDTNIGGARNVILAAKNYGISKVLGISSDKAVYPINLYGATKMAMEKLFIPAGFSCVRYGNVVGSRGSVIPILKRQRELGKVTITDRRMTRFWITQENAVTFILHWLNLMEGGEIFVPTLPSARLMDLVEVFAPNTEIEIIGIRPGEKIHETLITQEEVHRTQRFGDSYIIKGKRDIEGEELPLSFEYTSDTNTWWLTKEEIKEMDNEY